MEITKIAISNSTLEEVSSSSQNAVEILLDVFKKKKEEEERKAPILCSSFYCHSKIEFPFYVMDIDVDRSTGNLVIVDWTNFRVLIFNVDNEKTYESECLFELERCNQYQPYYVSVNQSNGNIAVVYTLNHQVIVFDREGKYLFSFGSVGKDYGELYYPRGICYHENDIFVCDSENNRIQIFNEKGKFKSFLEKNFDIPHGVAVHGEEKTIFVTDTHHDKVKVFNKHEAFLFQFVEYGFYPTQFNGPRGISISNDGLVAIADTHNRRVQLFDKKGDYVGNFLSPDDEELRKSLDGPRKVVFNKDGDLYVLNQTKSLVEIFKPCY